MFRYDGTVDHPAGRELLLLALLGAFTGVLAGGCAVIFRYMIAFFHNLAFRGTVSLHYDALAHADPSPWGVGIILIPLAGALLVAFLVRNFAPGARSHGVPQIMYSIYYREAKIHPVLALIKSLSASISIGTGASIGREGPIIQITASVGSAIGGWLRFPGRVRTVLLAAAAAGGVAGSFDSPLGGVLFTIELFLPAVSAAALLPVSIAAVVATLISRSVFGTRPSLPVPIPELLSDPLISSLPSLVVLGLVVGVISTLFIVALCKTSKWFDSLSGNYYIRHAFGMVLVGAGIWFFLKLTGNYYVEGLGYSTIFDLLNGRIVTFGLLLLLLAGKFIATSVSLGSGGSGGVFCPSLFLGALSGALVGELLALVLPAGLAVPRELLVLAGMAAAVGAITGTVLTGIVMVAELTGCYELLASAALVSFIAFAVRRSWIGGGIYSQQLLGSNHSIPEGLQSAVWSSRRASDLMAPLPEGELPNNLIRVDADADMDAVLRQWNDYGADGAVVTRGGKPAGILRDSELAAACRSMAERMV